MSEHRLEFATLVPSRALHEPTFGVGCGATISTHTKTRQTSRKTNNGSVWMSPLARALPQLKKSRNNTQGKGDIFPGKGGLRSQDKGSQTQTRKNSETTTKTPHMPSISLAYTPASDKEVCSKTISIFCLWRPAQEQLDRRCSKGKRTCRSQTRHLETDGSDSIWIAKQSRKLNANQSKLRWEMDVLVWASLNAPKTAPELPPTTHTDETSNPLFLAPLFPIFECGQILGALQGEQCLWTFFFLFYHESRDLDGMQAGSMQQQFFK
jgi:hypothetical protein